MGMLKVENLKAYYITGTYGVERSIKAVDRVSFKIKENESFGIAGESGCGKSTLLKVLFGVVNPPLVVLEGSVNYSFESRSFDILSLGDDQLRKLRWRDFSYIPQGSMSVLNPVRKIHKTFLDVIKTHSNEGEKDYDPIVKEHIGALGLPLEVLKSYPHQLSGGMRQRTIIALATIFKPKIIFADEPTTALDVVVQRGVLELLKRVQTEYKNTFVIVTHDMAVHANIVDRIAIMYAGKIVEIGKVSDLFKKSLHPYTDHLINSLPRIGDKSLRRGVPGSPPSLANPPRGCRFNPRCSYAMDICKKKSPKLIEVGPDRSVACFLLSKEEKSS